MSTSPKKLTGEEGISASQNSAGPGAGEEKAPAPVESGAEPAYRGVEVLREIIRSSSLTALKQTTHCQDIQLLDLKNIEGPIYGHRMALILMAGAAMRMTFKIYYMSDLARESLETGLNKTRGSLPERIVADSIKEMCNVTAGSAKRMLESLEVSLGLSLPLSTRGFDEAFTLYKNNNSEVVDKWVLRTPHGEYVCSTIIQILNAKALDTLTWTPAPEVKSNDEDEMEFL